MATIEQLGAIAEVTVADFLAAAEGSSLYKLTGKVANLVNTTYGNFDLVDATGSVYVYGLTATQVSSNDKSFESLGIQEGDIVTLIGTRASYKETAQVGGPAYYVSHISHTESTIADFLAKETGDAWYKLTGTISNLKSEEYGNFDLVDETGSVYVYGLTAAPVAKNDKSFASLGLKEGDKVTLIGTRADYKGTAQVGGPAYYISHETGAAEEPETPGETDSYATNVTWSNLVSAYDDGLATINGVENVKTLKFGTSSKVGSADILIPAGTTKLCFYGVAWSGKAGQLVAKVGDTTLFTQDFVSNEGAAGNAPYTITASETDYYEIALGEALAADTTVTVSSVEGATRVILWGIQAK